jgi:fructose-bisphosphate aldolase class 1
MNPSELARIAGAMVAKRFDTIRLESSAENHRAYRELASDMESRAA